MEYIDKTQGAERAHTILNAFLLRCNNGGFRPNDDLYDKMASDKDPNVLNAETTYSILRRQLLEENNGRCCYCMRSLHEHHTTLEHIIPNKIESQQLYDEYKDYFAPLRWAKIVYARAFLANPRWPYRAFPHTVAYENLIPSCNGKFARNINNEPHAHDDRVSKCCNNMRGNSFVIPFVLNPTMVSQFKYLRNGLVIWPVSDNSINGEARKRKLKKHKETIDILQLNCPELVAIRRIWFFLSSLEKDCQTSEKDRTILYLTEEADLTPEEISMLQNFWNDNYWSLLEEFRYFNDKDKFE